MLKIIESPLTGTKKFQQLHATIYIFTSSTADLLSSVGPGSVFALIGQNLTAQTMDTPSLAHARWKSKRLLTVVPRPLVRREPLLAGYQMTANWH